MLIKNSSKLKRKISIAAKGKQQSCYSTEMFYEQCWTEVGNGRDHGDYG